MSELNLRDYFAARVLQSMMLCPLDSFGREGETRAESTCRVAYDYADAMLAAREAQS